MKINNFFEIKRGTRQVETLRIIGDTPLIVAKSFDNGVVQKIKPRFKKYPKNSITIDMFGNCFFQPQEFCADDNVHILINDKLTLFSGLYLVAVMRRYLNLKFSYGRQFRLGDANEMDIPLYIKDNDLDILKMETIISNLINPLIEKKKSMTNKLQHMLIDDEKVALPDTILYSNFSLTNLFLFERKDTQSFDEPTDQMPRVSMQNFNNGVVSTLDWNGKVYAGKTIVINDWGIPNYQNQPFVMTGRDSLTLRLVDRELNENIALYLMSVIKANSYKFGYSRKFNAGAIKRFDLQLLLPQTNGKPDGSTMEKITRLNKIKAMESKGKKLGRYIKIINNDKEGFDSKKD